MYHVYQTGLTNISNYGRLIFIIKGAVIIAVVIVNKISKPIALITRCSIKHYTYIRIQHKLVLHTNLTMLFCLE